MSTLRFNDINKIYDNGVQAVFDFNLEVEDKEFIVFVGPSGCGKSTTLRMIAGLEDITYGKLYIGDKLVNDVLPKDRDIAMVFQNYALFPHMSVYQNIAFGLKTRKVPVPVFDKQNVPVLIVDKAQIKSLQSENHYMQQEIDLDETTAEKYQPVIKENLEKIAKLKAEPSLQKVKYVKRKKEDIDKRVRDAAEILGLTEYLNRKPANLSGGQRQRVALGRAIVRNPKVFLMDEPLSNLDAKLRVVMRSEIINIHNKIGATTVYVTHDQTEAMTMASRIVVMKDGYIQQIGTPDEVYNEPRNMFVASFIGSPSMNFIDCTVQNGELIIAPDVSVKLSDAQRDVLKDYEGEKIVLGIRPEDCFVKVPADKEVTENLDLVCETTELLGHEMIVYGNVGGQKIVIKTDVDNVRKNAIKSGVCFAVERMHFFNKETTQKIG